MAQNPSEQPVPGDEPVAVAVELKSFRPVAFAGGKCFGETRLIRNQLIGTGAPDMNAVAGQFRERGRNRPARFRIGGQR